jgi:hypothetical protein
MGDRRVASPILYKGQRSLALQHRMSQRPRPEAPRSSVPIGPGCTGGAEASEGDHGLSCACTSEGRAGR